MVKVKLLGRVEVIVPEETEPLRFQKPFLLLFYLLLEGRRCNRDELERMIWEGEKDSKRSDSFRQAKTSLEKAGLVNLLHFHDDGLVEVPQDVQLRVDVEEFNNLLAEISSRIESQDSRLLQKLDVPQLEQLLERLCTLFDQGELLDDVKIKSTKYSSRFLRWLIGKRNDLKGRYCDLLEQAADHFLVLDERNLALRYSRKLLEELQDLAKSELLEDSDD